MVTPRLLPAAHEAVCGLLNRADRGAGRVLVGLTGPPGAGKSTLADALAVRLSADRGRRFAVAVPMDGFHLANAELTRLGLTERKGAPETFDVAGFVHLLRRLRAPAAGEVVYAPRYSRVLHESVGGAVPVEAGVTVVVVEGNYLLLPDGGWTAVRELLDLSIYLDVPAGVRVGSLVRRQRARGLDEAAAQDWVRRSDEANAALIATTRCYADLVLSRD